jgi:hypothetical protein
VTLINVCRDETGAFQLSEIAAILFAASDVAADKRHAAPVVRVVRERKEQFKRIFCNHD